MAQHTDNLDVLIECELVSLVNADRDLSVTAVHGVQARGIPFGAALCDHLSALSGLEAEIAALAAEPKAKIVVANVAVVDRTGLRARLDYVVVYNAKSDGFVVSITPSHANDDVRIEREQDLRSRMRLEAQIAAQATAISEANDSLKRINSDLVNFTRIISHDLKAPMRAIRYSADDIEAALRDDETPDADALDDLKTYTRRMSQMVSDLLAYSRLEDKSEATTLVDTRELVDLVASTLPRPAGLVITVDGDWPKIDTARALLDLVLRNLIDNAIKHHDQAVGQISLEARVGETFLDIAITDDGPGIPEKYREAVLRPFVRLEKDRSEGSGMGLSMVQNVVRKVGGSMAIESRSDGKRGLRINLSWPLTIKAI